MRFFDRKLEGPIEDLVQDTLLACIKGRHDFRREGGFRSYVFGIARHVLFAALRAKHRAAAIDVEVSRLVDLEPSPSRLVAHKREMRVLLDALRRLPIETQILLDLYHWQRLSGPELATALGIGERALRSRLHRAIGLGTSRHIERWRDAKPPESPVSGHGDGTAQSARRRRGRARACRARGALRPRRSRADGEARRVRRARSPRRRRDGCGPSRVSQGFGSHGRDHERGDAEHGERAVDLPPALHRVIARGLAADPAARWPSMRAGASAGRGYAQGG